MNEISLAELYIAHGGKVSDKWSSYLNEYDRIFFQVRSDPLSLLEIGVQNGGSLEIWAKYFPNAKNILGCDVNLKCGNLKFSESNIRLYVGDANSFAIKEEILENSPELDIVIDDGSHKSSDIIRSFTLYFPHIRSGGIYIAEDLHCSYWSPFEGGLHDKGSSIEFFKKFADLVNYQHWTTLQSRLDILDSFKKLYQCDFQEDVLSQIHSIEFINSMCVVRKAANKVNELGYRVISGVVADVNVDILPLKGKVYKLDPSLLGSKRGQLMRAHYLGRIWSRLKSFFS